MDDGASNTLVNMDARNITPPFTPGALRGGSHVHTFSGDGKWIAFTYEDHVLAVLDALNVQEQPTHEHNSRQIGVSVPAVYSPQQPRHRR